MPEEIIDVFCHCLPPDFCRAVERAVPRRPLMFDRAQTIAAMVDLDARRRVMDQFPGYCQLLSLASPTVEALAGPDLSPELARAGNDALADWVKRDPQRLIGFIASLPMNQPDAAAREAERAIHELGAAGCQIYTNVNGRPLDEPELLGVVEHLASLGHPIWLHPIRPMTHADYATEQISKFDLWWALGWPYETSAAMGRLVFAGLFDRWPDAVVITHHVGGMIPMMEGRLQWGLQLLGTRNPPELAAAVETDLQETPLAAFRRFYADTASFGARAALACGQAFFGTERLLFATDMPFDPEQGPGFIRETLRAIDELELSPEQRQAILSGNVRRLIEQGASRGAR